MSPILSVHEHLGFRTITNRIDAHVDPCLSRLGVWLDSHPPAVREAMRRHAESIIFSYVDTWGGIVEPPLPAHHARVGLICRTHTNPIADKRDLGVMAAEQDRLDITPRIFTTVAAAQSFLEQSGHPIVFLKGRHGTAGEQVRCITRHHLAQISLGEFEILQEAVVDPELYGGRKMVFRVYLLIHGGECFYCDRFFAVVHGVAYDRNSDSYDAQVRHAGYMQPDSGVRLIPGHHYWSYRRHLECIERIARRMLPLLQPIARASDRQTYALLGIDIIPTAEGEAKLIEVNNHPNMVHTWEVNQEVNIPMLTGLMKRVMFDADDDHWHVCVE
jgi:prolyl 4-hydroxylase